MRKDGRSAPFKHIVSLGAHCSVRYQIDRVFGVAGSGPFEWTVTAFQSALDGIKARFAGIAESFHTISDGHSIVDHKYGICYHHEFERDHRGSIVLDESSIAKAKSKMQHKSRRLLANMEQGPILFVRYGSEKKDAVANISLADEPMRVSRLNELVNAIETQWPALNFSLAYVNHGNIWGEIVCDQEIHSRVKIFDFEWITGTHWHENHDHWNKIFDFYKENYSSSESGSLISSI